MLFSAHFKFFYDAIIRLVGPAQCFSNTDHDIMIGFSKIGTFLKTQFLLLK